MIRKDTVKNMVLEKFMQEFSIDNIVEPYPDEYMRDLSLLRVLSPFVSNRLDREQTKRISIEANEKLITDPHAQSCELISHPKHGVVGIIVRGCGRYGCGGRRSSDEFFYEDVLKRSILKGFKIWLKENASYQNSLGGDDYEWIVGDDHTFVYNTFYLNGKRVEEFVRIGPRKRRWPVCVNDVHQAIMTKHTTEHPPQIKNTKQEKN